MILIAPKSVTLESSNVPESLYIEYDRRTTYVLDDYVYVTLDKDGVTEITPHKIYKALAGTTGDYPPDNIAKWQDLGGTNRWKMFDEFLNTQTELATAINVEIDVSNCDKIGLFNVDADSITILIYDNSDSSLIQTYTKDMTGITSVVVPIYIYADVTADITISKTGTAKCGACSPGLSTYFGTTQWGVTPKFIDYSIKSEGAYGVYVSEGAWAKEIDGETLFNRENIDNIYEDLVNARGQIVMIDSNENDTGYRLLHAMGYIDDWTIVDMSPSLAKLEMIFMGVI
jgi:hypothetical protein